MPGRHRWFGAGNPITAGTALLGPGKPNPGEPPKAPASPQHQGHPHTPGRGRGCNSHQPAPKPPPAAKCLISLLFILQPGQAGGEGDLCHPHPVRCQDAFLLLGGSTVLANHHPVLHTLNPLYSPLAALVPFSIPAHSPVPPARWTFQFPALLLNPNPISL